MHYQSSFIDGIFSSCPELTLLSSTDPNLRGSQVSFAYDYPLIQARVANGVIGDFRAPNISQFGITPLYIDKDDIDIAITKIVQIVTNPEWDKPEYHARSKVT